MIVLDTHIFIWYALDDARLDANLKATLGAAPRDVLLPSICLWEAMLLGEKGRLEIRGPDPGGALRKLLLMSGFQEAPLTGEIAILSRSLAFNHDDPADRFIAATAHAHNALLATADERLRGLPWVKLANQ